MSYNEEEEDIDEEIGNSWLSHVNMVIGISFCVLSLGQLCDVQGLIMASSSSHFIHPTQMHNIIAIIIVRPSLLEVIAYIVYIIHLYDSGKLGGVGPNQNKAPRTSRTYASDKVSQKKWERKLWKDD